MANHPYRIKTLRIVKPIKYIQIQYKETKKTPGHKFRLCRLTTKKKTYSFYIKFTILAILSINVFILDVTIPKGNKKTWVPRFESLAIFRLYEKLGNFKQ